MDFAFSMFSLIRSAIVLNIISLFKSGEADVLGDSVLIDGVAFMLRTAFKST